MIEMNTPAPRNALDVNRQGLIGKPLDRVEGRLKVTGQAPYAYEVAEGNRAAYGVIVEATVAKGRVADVDTSAAERAPGVLMVWTYKNAPKQAPWGPLQLEDRFARSSPQLSNDRVRHYGESVAFVVAESFEQATAAARAIRVRYETEPGKSDLSRHVAEAQTPPPKNQQPADSFVGNFDAAFAAAAVQLDSTYTTPVYIHAQMEPQATVAHWKDGKVVVECSAQLLKSAQKAVANTLQIPVANVQILSKYIGGGFGGKLPVYADVMLSAMASRQLNRPVKTALTRQQMFHMTTHRSNTIQRVRLGANRDGTLTAIAQESLSHSASFDNYYEAASLQTRTLYAGANRATTDKVVKLDLPISDSTRAPGEAVGMMAIEQAMDELAEKLGMDPVDLRVKNEPAQDPEKNIPYSSRQLLGCLYEGSKRFGWSRRNAKPAQVRDGRWWIGMGMASSTRGNLLRPSQASVTLDRDGVLTARMAMTDIGTGSYTVLTQIAAEMMGLPPSRVRMLLGDSEFPETPGSGGSFGAASSGSGLFDACTSLRDQLARRAGIDPAQAVFAEGRVSGGGKSAGLASLVGPLGLEAHGEIKPGAMAKKYSQQSYGAHFAEVAVDMDTGEIRLRRMLGVFSAGRILNLKTATSQATGGMIWGVSNALHEDAVIDDRYGMFVNHDLAEYHVSVHADIPTIEAIFLPEVDDKTNPLKSKGIGELGISGAGAAVANAVYNACGVRIREYPLTLDKVIAGMADPRAA